MVQLVEVEDEHFAGRQVAEEDEGDYTDTGSCIPYYSVPLAMAPS